MNTQKAIVSNRAKQESAKTLSNQTHQILVRNYFQVCSIKGKHFTMRKMSMIEYLQFVPSSQFASEYNLPEFLTTGWVVDVWVQETTEGQKCTGHYGHGLAFCVQLRVFNDQSALHVHPSRDFVWSTKEQNETWCALTLTHRLERALIYWGDTSSLHTVTTPRRFHVLDAGLTHTWHYIFASGHVHAFTFLHRGFPLVSAFLNAKPPWIPFTLLICCKNCKQP